ncbi:MAG: alpha-L-arabinofuranosidase C-terminal domain-containing protein [Bacteroidota bacterium]
MKRVNNENNISKQLWICLYVVFYLILGGKISHAQTYFTVDISNPGALVADICRGQQIEEFNHQFQGGLYAQLINNPSFEEWTNPISGWTLVKSGSSNGKLLGQTSFETGLINSRQKHCIKLEVTSAESGNVGLANGGYWGIGLKNNTAYKVSFWAKKSLTFSGTLKVKLENNDGIVCAQSADFTPSYTWQHFTCELTTSGISSVVGTNRFVIYASSTGEVYFDVVTVMPPTWKNRPNGLRPDLAEKMAALKLRYIQFPGGCTAESAHMDTCWNWKNSIGPLEERAGATRVGFGYKNDHYFGLDEYFQLCEDMGAEPVYTTSAGINERPEPDWWPSSLCPLDKMQPIIDDILDLLEYCNGSASTYWGSKRAANGHPLPYNLKYIEIGNENYFMLNEYNVRYPMIYKAVKAAYPDIQVMYNGNCFGKEPSHTYGNPVDFTDNHFYFGFGTNLYNRYDTIDPACKKICVAEYACMGDDGSKKESCNLLKTIADAVFMLGCERNSEKMWWTGYGNYGALSGHNDFGPNIVVHNSVSSYGSPSYYMQKILFSDNQGTRVLPFTQNTANCFWSASVDTESGKNDVLLKVANNKSTSESVIIVLKGVHKIDRVGHSSTLTGAPDDENSIENPTKVVPSESTFSAGSSFKYQFPAFSITVLRIGLLK